MSLKIIQNGTPVDATKIWIGGNIQAECLRVWSTEANAWVYESATELAGTLPLTFRSDGTALIDYRIYGNTVDMPINLWTATGSQYQIDLKTPLKAGRAYTLTTFKEGIADRADNMYMYDSNNIRITGGVCEHSDGSRIYVTLTPNKDVWRVTVSNTLTDALRTLTEGDTPPDEYISPETTEVQSVGVRTENLFDPNAAEISGVSMTSDYLPLDPSGQYLTIAFDIPLRASYSISIEYYDNSKAFISGGGVMGEAYKTRESVKLGWKSEAQNAAYAKVTLSKDLTNVLIQNGSTDGAYIPYGYKLPMVSRNDLMGGLPIKLLYYANGTTIMGQGVELTNVPAGAYTIHSKQTSTGRYHDIIYIVRWIGTSNYSVTQSPAREAHTFTLSSDADRLDIYTVYRPAEGLMESWNDVGYEYVYLTTESTDTPIYIGDTQLMKDEYVSYSEQKIYKRTENVMPPSEKQTIESNGMTLYADGEGRYYLTGRTNDAATFNIPLIKEFTIPSRADEGVCMFFNTFVNGNVSFSFFYDNTWIDKWSMVTLNRITTTYSIMAGKICNNIQIYIPANVTLNDSISPAFTKGVTLPEYIPYFAPQSPPVPLPQLPTFSDADTVLDYEETPAPEEVWVKYHKK